MYIVCSFIVLYFIRQDGGLKISQAFIIMIKMDTTNQTIIAGGNVLSGRTIKKIKKSKAFKTVRVAMSLYVRMYHGYFGFL